MRLVSIAAIAAAFAATACASSGTTHATANKSSLNDDPGVPNAPNQVVIYQFIFKPKVLRVPVGTTVNWINHDIAAHTATRNGGADQFESGNLSYHRGFSHTFEQPGTYDYICFYHPGMKATVIVTPATTAEHGSSTTVVGESGGAPHAP